MKNNIVLKLGLISLLSFFVTLSCVEPFDVQLNIDSRLLVIEGTLADLPNETFLQLREAIPNGSNSSVFRSLKNAKVRVIEDGSNTIEFIEDEDGLFFAPPNFVGKPGSSYVLEFTTDDGSLYQSSPQVLVSAPPIKKIYQVTEAEGTIVNGNAVPANHIYIDTDDPAGLGNNYLWSWKLFERQYICSTCEGGRYYLDPLPAGRCIEEDFLKRRGVIYDYACDSPCWEVINSNTVNTQSDQLVDGLTITARKIAEIPYYNLSGGLIEVKQQAISADSYAYLKLLVEQGQNTGGLADTPPAALVGNVKSLDKDEIVTGFFLVSGMVKERYWIDRSDLVERGFRPLGLLGGREIRLEPPPTGPTDRPPMAPCLVSKTRIKTKPEGFLFD